MRIIPARAGFTPAWSPTIARMEDHPRSRGVYEAELGEAAHEGGSSPLARGLQLGAGLSADNTGIIPARAGFTSQGAAAFGPRRDHPRSRGVYCPPTSVCSSVIGSSPLARGLPAGRRGRRRSCGIIPARAGFTPPSRPATPGCGDHPRSRGVYAGDGGAVSDGLGSSPLARGLREPLTELFELPRIIPARAGFTRCLWRG